MHKRLKNLRKMNARKKKQKELKKEQEAEEASEEEFIVHSKPKSVDEILADSDSELEDMETDQPKANKGKQHKASTWIEEDPDSIVDFTDPSAISKITATKPGQQAPQTAVEKKKDRGFKTAPDGRLIIEDDDSDSDSEKKKKGIRFSSDSDSEDNSSAAETLPLTNRKRKRAESVSVKSGFSGVGSQGSMKYKSGGVGIHRPLGASSSSSQKTPGSDYKSKKAKGDVKRKGKFDPYAYLPLQRTALNKRYDFVSCYDKSVVIVNFLKEKSKGGRAI